jgi:cytidylate kinase
VGTRAASPFTITIDGPAAAGKSTVGAQVAHRLEAVFFDTGLLYRAVTHAALERGLALDDAGALAQLAQDLDIRVERPSLADGRQSDVLVNGRDVTLHLRTPEIDRAVSPVSAHAEVRAALLPAQRRIGRSGRVVMVGRDIGSVVLPEAELKVYVDASPEERARRRHGELSCAGSAADLAAILAGIRARDQIDSERSAAPLRVPDGAMVIDTDHLVIEEVVERIVEAAEQLMRANGNVVSAR